MLYSFLDITAGEFGIDDIVSYIKKADSTRSLRLASEVELFIGFRRLAFPSGTGRWITRRAFFEPLSFVIFPSRLELVNGILIPGHRCVPFANDNLLPNEYTFYWENKRIPFTTTEGPPEEFYPYYNIFGEEYSPQYVARDNTANEEAFLNDPYEDPPEVSIKTLDMREIYMEASFVPGDYFIVTTLDWEAGKFHLTKVKKDNWTQHDMNDWLDAAEEGFEKSFEMLGPGSCTEEQIAYAYWYGSSRMRETPAYALEEFLYERSNRVETVPYGIETRFWYAGREIPDRNELDHDNIRPDATPLELIFFKLNIPVSEFVIQAYIRDSLYRDDDSADYLLERLIPASIGLEQKDKKIVSEYVETLLDDFKSLYNPFTDKCTGPVRSRAGELHTAVIDLAARLKKRDVDSYWLPPHTFIILSQIQLHTAGVLEDLSAGDSPAPDELEALDSSLDSMIDTYEDLKELIENSMNNFRRNNFALIRPGADTKTVIERIIQISIGGIDVWRRLIVPENLILEDLHEIIQTVFGWHKTQPFRFISGNITDSPNVQSTPSPCLKLVKTGQNDGTQYELSVLVKDISGVSSSGLIYEYGTKWNVRIIVLSRHESAGTRPVRCVAGSGAAPPEFIGGPLKYKRVLSALENGNDLERSGARHELGANYVHGEFDMDACNRSLKSISVYGN